MEKKEFERIVTFCILMENYNGIIGKAPSYIEEKFNVLILGQAENPEAFLDLKNSKKLKDWKKTWWREE